MMARVSQATQRLIEQCAADDDEDASQPSSNGITIQLLQVRRGSVAYTYASDDRDSSWNRLALTGSGLKNPEDSEWTEADLSALKELSEVAHSLGCSIEFRKPYDGRKLGDVLATITPVSFDAAAASAYVIGQWSSFALIERAGGAGAMRCGIRVPKQPKMVFCTVDDEKLVRELGRHIYEWVHISGEATWLRYGWRLKTMKITGMKPKKRISLVESAKAIHDAGGFGWDNVADPDAVLAEMRHGG